MQSFDVARKTVRGSKRSGDWFWQRSSTDDILLNQRHFSKQSADFVGPIAVR
jgi:hypothetical protein